MDTIKAEEEFSLLKTREQTRNAEYYLLRQAVSGNFRWPRNWPAHIPKVHRNLCKPITHKFATYLMGKGFTFNVERPNTLEFRESAERTEKILRKLLDLAKSDIQYTLGAQTGSELGRTVYKVYKKGNPGAQHACFSHCQPDYFYGIPAGDDYYLGDWSTVYYSYPIDILEAKRTWGEREYKTESDLSRGAYYSDNPARRVDADFTAARRIPVLEAWTKDEYLLKVGGVVIENGPNPYKWKESGEGFIPFVVIENIRNSNRQGEADIAQSRELNEYYNQLVARKFHIINRYLDPTLVWEGAPSNYAEILAQTLAGGGAIPARLGSKLQFLTHQGPNPAVLELEQSIRAAILENAGINEIALQGQLQGSINTGPSAAAQYQPILSTIEMKRTEWQRGLRLKYAMMLELQEQIGDSKILGEAVINQDRKSLNASDGDLVKLSGKDIQGLRDVTINWPGILPKDDFEASRLEMEKASQGMQSIYTTLEKLGEDYPDDEIARIRMENNDPSLRGEKVAEQLRAQTPLIKAQGQQALGEAKFIADEQARTQEMGMAEGGGPAPGAPPEDENGVMARIKQLQKAHAARLDMEGDEPVITAGAPSRY